ncbi:transcriptional regulatory protein CseB [Microlunatus endophyticus]|uniref:Transcriptional regulatory protein CseB n=1 Tax=Microlunatus endophyticus TaxID=1716077 RepID=A0A917S3V8_9ACTN|nr:response regulator transcription factor [Microlunatus endophyticus]GGL53593.1 transcriptional regulatory protein CseB [Microlunatus endophyticus]
MTSAGTLLLVEDDEVIGEATQLNLERYDYQVTWVQDGLDAWRAFTERSTEDPFQIVLCDVMLPGLDGISLCRRIREAGNTPVVLISARTESIDIVSGLEAGADDYVTKPFDIQVLLARLRSVSRRAVQPAVSDAESGQASPADGDEHLIIGDLDLDRRALEMRRGDKLINLTPTEMRLLLELAEQPGVVLSRAALLQRVWDYPEWEEDDHLVNVHIQRLRTKIGTDRIETVRGFGYKLRR